MEKPVIEQWAEDEYREGVSAGAAARELCRMLGCSGAYPTLKRILEDMLADANRRSHEFMAQRDSLREVLRDIPKN